MTKKQIEEKYGNVSLKFESYYKYSFRYEGIHENGDKVVAHAGGMADDIYKWEVSRDDEENIIGLDPYYVMVFREGKKIAEFTN